MDEIKRPLSFAAGIQLRGRRSGIRSKSFLDLLMHN
jgi:hypothetical protein